MKSIEDLIAVLTLKCIDNQQYTGISKSVGSPYIFGGQLVGQALDAAYRTVDSLKVLHSLHSYFLEPGNLETSITYKVTKIRDGGSFANRSVAAIQGTKTIFILIASFHKQEQGYDHQIKIKQGIKTPEELLSWEAISDKFGAILPDKMKAFLNIERPIAFKPTAMINPLEKKDLPPSMEVWFKVKGVAENLSKALKLKILAYISDYNILMSCLYPNASKADFVNTQMVSLDHAMWFYRDFDLDDWLLFSIESPSTFGARGFARGNIFTREGKLVASVAQEGLIRLMN